MNNSRQLLALRRLYQNPIRNGSTDVKIVVAPRFHKLKENQKKFSVDDGVPIYLKKGFVDKMVYRASVVLTLVGVGFSLETFCVLCFGKH